MRKLVTGEVKSGFITTDGNIHTNEAAAGHHQKSINAAVEIGKMMFVSEEFSGTEDDCLRNAFALTSSELGFEIFLKLKEFYKERR